MNSTSIERLPFGRNILSKPRRQTDPYIKDKSAADHSAQAISEIPFWRPLAGLSLAIAINLLLFFFIYKLVTPEHAELPDYELLQSVDFIRYEKPLEEPEPEKKELPKKPPPEQEPVPMNRASPQPSKPNVTRLKIPAPDVDVPLSMTGGAYLGNYVAAPAAAQGLILDTNAVPIFKVEPVYPPRAMRNSISGVVTVEFIINEDGSVRDPFVIKANPPKMFDRVVLRAVQRWRFNPKLVDGKAVARRARQDVRFSLDN